ncbi:MAG TPA: iron ABC transporter permease [Sphingomonadales bacterium]
MSRASAVPLVMLPLVMLLALMVGSVAVAPRDLLAALLGAGDERLRAVIMEIRLPRLLLGALVGGSLGLAGAALQGLLRNPLADPGVVGVSAAAALGAVVAIHFGLAAMSPLMVPGLAIVTSLLATAVLYVVARRDASVLTLILAGVALSSFANALTSLVINLAPNPYSLNDIVMWLLGSLSNRSTSDLWLALPFIAAGSLLLFICGRSLDALTLGEDTARTLGVDLARLRLLVVGGTALAVGAGVAVAGAIGFVGLVVPHLVRPFVGHVPSRLLLPSALGGALLVVLADLLVRLAPGEHELKLGVVTALIGTPFFFHLLLSTRRAMR